MLAASMICFVTIGTLLAHAALLSDAAIDLRPVIAALVGAFVLYCVGIALLTAIPSSRAGRQRVPWTRHE